MIQSTLKVAWQSLNISPHTIINKQGGQMNWKITAPGRVGPAPHRPNKTSHAHAHMFAETMFLHNDTLKY